MGQNLDFLQPGKHLVQVHRFRYVRAVTCALGTIELVVEETFYGESVKGALQALIEKLRGRRPQETFLPTA
ncbi:MAG: hypothetical protein FVQ06_00465 [candidate division NC10 bacterium]|nr:hypothetical protein [candidate division NC10 bacterium]